MSSQSLVSVIIPVFNAEKSIEKAIEGVLHQTHANKELIIIDGGSTDRTLEIIKSFNGRIAQFQSEKDKGIYDAINKGLDLAEGEWIYILGADDRLNNPEVIEKMLDAGTKNDKIIFGNVKNEGRLHSRIPEIHASTFDGNIRWRNTLHQQAVFYHRSIFDDFRFDTTFKVLADYDLHLKLFIERVKWKKAPVIVAVCHAQGLSKRFNRGLYKEELRMKKKRMGILFWAISLPVVVGKYFFKKFTS